MSNDERTEKRADGSSRTDYGPPPQVAFPRRASWRTFFQALVAFLPTANGIVLAVQELFAQPPYREAMPGWVYVAVNAAVVLGAFLAKVVAQIMANPAVEAWLQQHVPRAAAQPAIDELGPDQG